MLSRFLSVTARLPDRSLHAGAAPPPPAAHALVRSGIRPESLPRHVAMVMDGNRRWAQARGLPTAEGHEAGCRALERTVRLSRDWGIRALTVFAFSQENFGRPQAEVDYVMGLIERLIRSNLDEYARTGVRLHVIGDPSRRPASLQSTAREADEACRQLAREVEGGALKPDDIDEPQLASKLATTSAVGELELSCPDLVIRTSGEQRLSNFLMWQSAYSELYFTDALWPDFDEDEYLRALKSFQARQRRFGQRNVI
ncbi:hypothetical protein U9M48_012647 [Paspalum notatum var. saurae]|uniref:Alkyl transferase n=1 Tax=Paspalum notatum var. saurae TaxID=547442 RepID=A0AAQ3SYN8_PASNO